MKERGLTLVEILVSLAVLGMIVASVYGIAMLQQRSYAVQSDVVTAQQNARRIIQTLTGLIRKAGFGVDPPVAFDFSYYCCAGGFINSDTCNNAPPPPQCRDRTDAPDEIVFLMRDPNPLTWGRAVSLNADGVTGELLSADIEFPENLTIPNIRKGSILLFMCDGAAGIYNYVVVREVAQIGEKKIQITPDTGRVLTNIGPDPGGNTFLGNSVVPFSNSCYSNGNGLFPSGPWVFPIRLYRIYVHQEGETPFLMLDDGTIDPDTNRTVPLPIASDVEDMQVAYILRNGNVLGDAVGTVETPNPSDFINCPNTYFDERKYYFLPQNDPCRMNTNPANIVALRITIVVRTPYPDPTLIGEEKPSLANPIENREGITDEDARKNYAYRRIIFPTTIYIQNMLSTAQFGAVQSP